MDQETPGDDLDIQLNFISGKQTRHALRQGDDRFLALVTAGNFAEWMIDTTTDTTDRERRDLQVLFDEFQDVFPEELPSTLPPRRTIDHHIEVLPRVCPSVTSTISAVKTFTGWIAVTVSVGNASWKGLIKPSRSPYRAPVFFIKKLDGSFRLVCDWRELNKITVKNEACLPNIDGILNTIQGCKYFTKLDLRSGYNQVRVRDEDVAKTAINTPLGHYEFKVMGFQTLQRSCNLSITHERCP